MNCMYCNHAIVNGYEICDDCFFEQEEQVYYSSVPCYYCNGKVQNGYDICDDCFFEQEEKVLDAEKYLEHMFEELESTECQGCRSQVNKVDENGICSVCEMLGALELDVRRIVIV